MDDDRKNSAWCAAKEDASPWFEINIPAGFKIAGLRMGERERVVALFLLKQNPFLLCRELLMTAPILRAYARVVINAPKKIKRPRSCTPITRHRPIVCCCSLVLSRDRNQQRGWGFVVVGYEIQHKPQGDWGCTTGTTHNARRTAICYAHTHTIVHAPHAPCSHPKCVPVKPWDLK